MMNYLNIKGIILPAYCADYLWHIDAERAQEKLSSNLDELRCHNHRLHRSSGLSPEQEALLQTENACKDHLNWIKRKPTSIEQLCLHIHFSELSLIGIYIGNKYQQASAPTGAYN